MLISEQFWTKRTLKLGTNAAGINHVFFQIVFAFWTLVRVTATVWTECWITLTGFVQYFFHVPLWNYKTVLFCGRIKPSIYYKNHKLWCTHNFRSRAYKPINMMIAFFSVNKYIRYIHKKFGKIRLGSKWE